MPHTLFQVNYFLNNRQVPISNFSAFFFEESLTARYCSWGYTLSKSRNALFPNSFSVKKQFFSLEKLNKCCNRNKFKIETLKSNVRFCLYSSRAIDIISRNYDVTIKSFWSKCCQDTRIFVFLFTLCCFSNFLIKKIFDFILQTNIST